MVTIGLGAVVLSAAVFIAVVLVRALRDYLSAQRERRLAQADWRARRRLANESRIDAEKASAKLAVLPFHRTCVGCGTAFDRSPMVVDMRCDACQAKAFDETLEADREDWSKGGQVIRKGWQ